MFVYLKRVQDTCSSFEIIHLWALNASITYSPLQTSSSPFNATRKVILIKEKKSHTTVLYIIQCLLMALMQSKTFYFKIFSLLKHFIITLKTEFRHKLYFFFKSSNEFKNEFNYRKQNFRNITKNAKLYFLFQEAYFYIFSLNKYFFKVYLYKNKNKYVNYNKL